MKTRWILCAIIACVGVLGLPLLHVPPGRDQGIFGTAGLMVNAGAVLYRDVFEVKQPLILLIYGWAFRVAGQASAEVINALDQVFRLIAIPLFYAIGHRLGGRAVGLMAAAWYGVFSLCVFGYYWHASQAESFSGPLLAAAFYCALRGREPDARGGWWIFAGFAVTAAAAFKVTALAPGAAIVLMALTAASGPIGARRWQWRGAIARVALGVAGSLGVLGPLFIYFASHDALADVFDVQVAFNGYHAWRYPMGDILKIQFAIFLRPDETPAGLIQTAALFASVFFLWRGPARARWLVLWYWLAWVTVPVQGKLWHYHYALLLPPQALLVGLALFGKSRAEAGAPVSVPRWITRFAVGAVVLGQVVGVALDFGRHYADDVARFTGRVSARDYEKRPRFQVAEQHYSQPDLHEAAAWLRGRAQDGDGLIVFGLDQTLNFLAALVPPTRYIYAYPLVADMPGYAEDRARHRRRFMAELEARPPRFIAVPAGPIDLVSRIEPWAQLQRFTAFYEWATAHYERATVIGAYTIFERKAGS